MQAIVEQLAIDMRALAPQWWLIQRKRSSEFIEPRDSVMTKRRTQTNIAASFGWRACRVGRRGSTCSCRMRCLDRRGCISRRTPLLQKGTRASSTIIDDSVAIVESADSNEWSASWRGKRFSACRAGYDPDILPQSFCGIADSSPGANCHRPFRPAPVLSDADRKPSRPSFRLSAS
jgi:hypothetical protein